MLKIPKKSIKTWNSSQKQFYKLRLKISKVAKFFVQFKLF